ncbi:tRNA pseudouridine synthase-like 1 [Sitophilus oryzae]|uniref:tRNA pseudouridine synthase n=1 Tax=Sitophilus oryzae TaxID=7048 RepID=A0A6J2XIL7_SITOR|nr:tRNA pseudouridine synthase-like 1 [Sitophilus oryzae]
MGLQFLQPINDPVVYMASRTDAGVHALNTTCHVDLTKSDNSIYEPTVITSWLNTYFYREAVPIRVLGAKNVSDDFNCKSAISRTYLYRILLAKLKGHSGGLSTVYIPIEELNRCHFIGAHEFDINIMRQAAKMFEGFHDFRTFMGKTKDDDRITRRSIDSVIIIERNFKDLGVRRCGAAIVGAATGKVSLQDIEFMLQIPSKHSWNSKLKTLPGHGLYLCNIEY